MQHMHIMRAWQLIGSMLLAPLMTPMIGLGLALNQGNAKLAWSSSRAIERGFLAALGISAVVALLTPGADLTPEVIARTEPNILDLLVALFSGSAAAYALARPSLAGTIADMAVRLVSPPAPASCPDGRRTTFLLDTHLDRPLWPSL